MPWIEVSPNQDYETFVDDEDVVLLQQYSWYFDGRYIKRKVNGKRNGPDRPRDPAKVFYLHREIMKTPIGMHTDHEDRNPLNNSRSNLRICTQADNNKNTAASGACYIPARGKWNASILHEGRRIYIGMYLTEAEAQAAYQAKSRELRGSFHAESV